MSTLRQVPHGARLIGVSVSQERPEWARAKREVTVTGTVTEHHELVTGHWFWKTVLYTIIVRLTDESMELLNEALRKQGFPSFPEGHDWIGIEVPPIDLGRFPEGATVEVLIGLNDEAAEYFLARSPRFVISVCNTDTNDTIFLPLKPL